MTYPHYRSIGRNYPTKSEARIGQPTKQNIMLRIEVMQRGKNGIYPHHVARDIAVEFGISLRTATDLVLAHIREEMLRSLGEDA